MALRLSYVGELGWELYTSADLGLRLWDLLWEAGRPYGVLAGGRGAFNAHAGEGLPAWGTDMTTEHDPYEAGLGFAVKPDKGDFVGREALLRAQGSRTAPQAGVPGARRPEVVVMGSEPVCGGRGGRLRHQRRLRVLHRAEHRLRLGLRPSTPGWGSRLEIEYFGERYPATVAEEPLFDPAMKRMRA